MATPTPADDQQELVQLRLRVDFLELQTGVLQQEMVSDQNLSARIQNLETAVANLQHPATPS